MVQFTLVTNCSDVAGLTVQQLFPIIFSKNMRTNMKTNQNMLGNIVWVLATYSRQLYWKILEIPDTRAFQSSKSWMIKV